MARPKKKSLSSVLILLFLLPFLLYAVKKIYDLRKGAAGVLADIQIDTQSLQGNINSKLWQNLAQGGEERIDMIGPVKTQISQLKPSLVRIDHIFDFYDVYKGPNNFDFSKLDLVVDSILKTGAKPMLSLTYTPENMTVSKQINDEPADWNNWYQLIKATGYHYSIEKNISGIYYEVWNEPDLFGGWHYQKQPSYSTLYLQTAKAIADGAKNSDYKIGGPATTGYYSNWIKSLFKLATDNGIRLDFISWHKYSKNISEYLNDFDQLNNIISDYPQFFDIERIISESGPNSDSDNAYDESSSAIHLMSLATHLSGKIHRIFTFEIVDGPNKRSENSSGWGILTHPNNGSKPKPRYFAIQFLNNLQGQRLSSQGDGSWVTSISTKTNNKIQTLVVNYDPENLHNEVVPILFKNLNPKSDYIIKTTKFLGATNQKTVHINTSTHQENILMSPNTALLIEITPK